MGLLGSLINFGTSLIAGGKASKASRQAAEMQYKAAQEGIAESRRQFDTTRADFQPYQEAGVGGLGGITALLGIDGPEAQMAAIQGLRESPLFEQLFGAGEETILQNASATGGLRGGNTQDSLARFGRDTLSDVIQRQLVNFGGLAGMGMGAAGSVGNFGAAAVANQANLRGQGADAKASDRLTRGGIAAQNWQNAGSTLTDILKAIMGGGGGI